MGAIFPRWFLIVLGEWTVIQDRGWDRQIEELAVLHHPPNRHHILPNQVDAFRIS